MRIAPLQQSDANAHWFIRQMCCTPERGGLEVRFSEFRIGPPVINDPHDIEV
jgi:regulation of enolase protein 1 (concanavalin A-like superfamily)